MPDIKPALLNQQSFQIFITHIPTNQTISFDAWVTGFADNFVSSWNGTPVYGRMDDLYTFQRTSRKLSVAFDVVSANRFEAAKNLQKLNALTQFLYPVYSEPHGTLGVADNSRTLQAAPLLKMKWNGLIANALDGRDLVGFLQGFTYNPDLLSGQFFLQGRGSGAPFIAYQNHSVQLEFTVLHTHLTGWTATTVGKPGGGNRYIFGGSEAHDVGAAFPHALSDAVQPPVATTTPGDAQAAGDSDFDSMIALGHHAPPVFGDNIRGPDGIIRFADGGQPNPLPDNEETPSEISAAGWGGPSAFPVEKAWSMQRHIDAGHITVGGGIWLTKGGGSVGGGPRLRDLTKFGKDRFRAAKKAGQWSI